MELAPDFNEFFELLNAHRVEYVLVRPTPENADRLLTAVGVIGGKSDALD